METSRDRDAGIDELRQRLAAEDAAPTRSELARLLDERGCERWRAGDAVGSLADLSEALQLDPDLATAYNNRACVSAATGNTERAFSDLAAAVRLDPSLAEARGNLRILSRVAGDTGTTPITTVTGALSAADGKTFCEGLTTFLQESVPVTKGFEDCREDAIGDVVARVLATAERSNVPLAEALRNLRRSSTRGWVRSLIATYRRRGGSEVPEELPDPSGTVKSLPAAPAIRIEELLDDRLQAFLDGSRPSVRARRRIVWNVFVGSLKGGIRLTRKEVVASLRAMGISKRKATDGQITSDLDRIVQVLRGR